MSVISIKTFTPPAGCRGENGPAVQGNFRKGELRGIIKINKDKCVGCDTCSKMCPVDAISGGLGVAHRIKNDACLSCGQCLIACPFGAIEQMSFVDEVMKALDNKELFCVAHPSPADRVSIAEEFGGEPGDLSTGQLVNALRKVGFTVYDVNQSADQTFWEEGMELVKRIRYWILNDRSPDVAMMAHHPLPQFTSCCPAWVRNMEGNYAGWIPHISTTKSPIQMGGTMAKAWAAEHVWHKDPSKIYMVAVAPCTAKIYEASRPEFHQAYDYLKKAGKIPASTPQFPDIDAVLTVRDLAELFRRKGINPLKEPKDYEPTEMELYTGAGTIFGASGGVMEAAIRTAYRALSGEDMADPNVLRVRGRNEALVTAEIAVPVKALGGKIFKLRVAVVNGALQGLPVLMHRLSQDRNAFHFIEVMNCPGGCVNGGGQPVQNMGTAWLKPALPLPLRA